MRAFVILGALLIVFGVAVLVNQGMDFSTRGRSVSVGSLEITRKHQHHIPPALGVVALLGGVALVMLDRKR
jgi:drug/metabolite transporter (DMT)-like permease